MATPRVFNWKPAPKDERDYKFSAPPTKTIKLPDSFLLPNMPLPYDQGTLGSCTAQGIARLVQTKANFMPSRLMIYYLERELEGTINQDAGATIRSGIKVINSTGVCPEPFWPYIISKFTQRPPLICYQKAKMRKALKYSAVLQTETALKSALFSGLPVVFGFYVKGSFNGAAVAKTGIYKPKAREATLGGHCVVLVGWNANGNFVVANSWGTAWGKNGYFDMPVSEVINPAISADFWVLEAI